MSEAPPAIPSPAAPAPEEPAPAAAPMAALAYYGAPPLRPWLVPAVGITSIVIASLSIVTIIVSGLMFLPYVVMSQTVMMPAGVPAGSITQAGTITKEDAEVIVAAMHARQPLSGEDQAALASALPLADLPLAPPLDGKWTVEHVSPQISMTQSWNSGSEANISYSFQNGGDISLSNGSVTVSYWDSAGNWTDTTLKDGAVIGTNTHTYTSEDDETMTPTRLILSATAEVLSLGLAVLLLVAGIMTVRSSPAGRRLHLWWAWLKICVALFAAFASYLFWHALFVEEFYGGEEYIMAAAFAGIGLLLSLAWPIVVLILLRSRSLREFYSEPEAAPA